MKKQLFLAAAFASAFALAGLNQVSADTTTGQNVDSTAKFNIAKPTGDNHEGLYLQSAPSFDFGSVDMAKVITTGANLNDTTSETPLVVKDYTGSSKGWTVNAKMDPFKNSDDSDEITGTLKFVPTVAEGENITDNLAAESVVLPNETTKQATVGTAYSLVIGAESGKGQGISTINATDANLSFAAHSAAKADTYTANITWEVSGGAPTVKPAGPEGE